MNTYNILKKQKEQLEKITAQKPKDDEQRKAIERAKAYLIEINKYLRFFGDKDV